ncbi:N5-glutamine methyltransferase family protein [Streptantibioticus cattleyicolor]|uniref:N5-glutamine methyltransferase family protein n=1 Tax=Streptantibioticus cattleyicolor TaxID=29303 RepID=UPI000213D459|nr:class I SAM-dependent methyltransferase [Streptantibioticus cattleyicolor]CCB72067.1 putative methylase [Streptantibioticus cattleyicolor NRRL 8057 = DSM 46488]
MSTDRRNEHITWTEEGVAHHAPWHSENGTPAPRRVVLADDRMKAATAHRLARHGTALLWRGDYHNARQLLHALARRIDRAAPTPEPDADPARAFHRHRQARRHRARVLGMLLVRLAGDHTLALRRAPDVRRACAQAYGPARGPYVVSLTELLGVLGALGWREKGVKVPALGARLHPHYGVFAPVRGEYVDLVARAPLPSPGGPGPRTAFDLGTGTGVLAAVLARRGVERVVATDAAPRALACARENVARLGLAGRVEVHGPALYPPGRAALVVCNPPWLPGRPVSTVEQGVYDPGGAMLHAFLDGLASRLLPGGEGWLVLSDLAERLGLRARQELTDAIASAGLRVAGRTDTRPRHPRAADPDDPLHAARAAEVTSLWRLTVRRPTDVPELTPPDGGRAYGG